MKLLVRLVAAVTLVMVGISCSSDDADDGGTESTTTTTAGAATSTTAASTASSATTATTQLSYGSECAQGSHPDCIDPDGDGRYEYLKGGAQCMRGELGDSGLCSDLDGDGVAGYPDSG